MHEPRDPITDELYPAGPIILADHQSRIIDEALSKDASGKFKYTTIIYSAPKKSGKSALSAAVVLYMAYQHPHSYVACLANDKKQSSDRLYEPIKTCFKLHHQLGGIFSDVVFHLVDTVLPNGTKIEAVPCDAASEAGSQPLMTAFSEIWGFDTDSKKQLYTEMTVPVTLYGRAIRWVESYAGYAGKSELLEQIYENGVVEGTPHPDFLDLQGRNGPVVTVNPIARQFTYWDTERRMAWQQDASYYEAESRALAPAEFRRVHHNEWVSSVDSFIQETWWDACLKPSLPILRDGDKTPMVVGIDMAVTGDCAALVGVTRDPDDPIGSIAVRAVKVFDPKALGGIIDQERLVRPVIEDWASRWNIICWVYDPREMSKLAQDLVRAGLGWFRAFGQGQPRAVSDKALYDMIVQRQVAWNPNTTMGDIGYRGSPGETLYKHITQAGSITHGDAYRIEKLSARTKIDAAIALSQAAYIAMQLVIDNLERDMGNMLEQLKRGEITAGEFSAHVRHNNSFLDRRANDG